jgi:hypothetical protein
VQKVKSVEQLETLIEVQDAVAAAFKGYAAADVVAAIEAQRGQRAQIAERPLRTVEFERIVSAPDEQPENEPDGDVQFAAFRVRPPRVDLPPGVRGLIVVPEMREIRVQVSFSRFDSISSNLQGEFDFDKAVNAPAPLMLPTGNQGQCVARTALARDARTQGRRAVLRSHCATRRAARARQPPW